MVWGSLKPLTLNEDILAVICWAALGVVHEATHLEVAKLQNLPIEGYELFDLSPNVVVSQGTWLFFLLPLILVARAVEHTNPVGK